MYVSVSIHGIKFSVGHETSQLVTDFPEGWILVLLSYRLVWILWFKAYSEEAIGSMWSDDTLGFHFSDGLQFHHFALIGTPHLLYCTGETFGSTTVEYSLAYHHF